MLQEEVSELPEVYLALLMLLIHQILPIFPQLFPRVPLLAHPLAGEVHVVFFKLQ